MEHVLSLVIFLPLITAAVVAVVRNEVFAKFASVAVSGIVFLLSLVLFLSFDFSREGFQFVTKLSWIPSLGISYHLGLDGMAVSLLVMTTLLFLAAFIWSWKIEDRPVLYTALFLLLETACLGVFSALDFFLFYIFWEGMLIPMYFIIGFWGHDRKVYAANKFFIYTFFGSLFLLLGLASVIVYGYFATGQITFDYIEHAKMGYPLWIQLAAFLLFGIGFAVKIPMFPVHTWLPDAHVEAPTAGSVILAGVLLKMGTFGFVRYSLPLFPDASKYYIPLIFTLSVIAIIYAAMMAIAQTHIKRLIAYSSISHMGIVTLGTFALDKDALNGAVYMMIAHGLSSGALFFAAGFIYDRIHSYNMDDLGGLARYLPNFAVLFMISGLAGIGLPGLAGFIAEFLVLLGTFKAHPVWAVIAGTGMILGAAYFLYMYKRVMLEEETITDHRREKWSQLRDVEAHHFIPFALILFVAFVMGLYPAPFVRIVDHTVKLVFGG
ncbi:NADH dehydrogenase subunit M [Hydrogenivirga caldilitoris]|uniref:NADH dehydrogenase subunit M n=1 Tax=Hydrogenivirga caldilitoris TaxID=246264 RepID=A0A497XXI5_9AQUI|nr:NuoM family protein [Hydrogenivirga caldilitoris]RLJ71483.1 NADH dehydrogenase subunit M [Hydrogenivirga caldilitoris]